MGRTTDLNSPRNRMRRAARAKTFAGISNALFGGLADRLEPYFTDLEEDLQQANIRVLHRTYLSEMLFLTVLGALSGAGAGLMVMMMLDLPFILGLVLVTMLPVMIGIIAFFTMYTMPAWRARKRGAEIRRNLPFATNHMSAVAGSGIPPSAMFELLVNFDEYGEIAHEADKIVTQVRAFGEDVTDAMRDVARHTPSEEMQEVLYGMVSTIETGGNLDDFLDERAERALFDYRIDRQKQIERLTTFASFYTALLVAAPLFLITILAILEMVGGNIAGFPIKSSCGVTGAVQGACEIGLIDIGAYFAIPITNLLFIIVLEVTQPEI